MLAKEQAAEGSHNGRPDCTISALPSFHFGSVTRLQGWETQY